MYKYFVCGGRDIRTRGQSLVSYASGGDEFEGESEKKNKNKSSKDIWHVDGYEFGIPAVLVILRQRLLDLDGLETEGLFRIPADEEEKNKAKKVIKKKGRKSKIDCNAYCAAELIFWYFREMKEPLLKNIDDRMLDSSLYRTDPGLLFEDILNRLDQPARDTFVWLLNFLLEVSSFWRQNRMSKTNLAAIATPNLFSCEYQSSYAEIAKSMERKKRILLFCLQQQYVKQMNAVAV